MDKGSNKAGQSQTYKLSDGTVREVYIAPPPPDPERQKAKRKYRRGLISALITLAVVVVLFLLTYFFIAEPIMVDGQSMLPTLQDGEQVLVTKYDYWGDGEPKLLDIVCCYYPDSDSSYIKRVVGLPGDTVELRAGDLYVNGVQIPQPFVQLTLAQDLGPVTVPEGHYFVMGDNRQNSMDSRTESVGPIPKERLGGHARYVVFPFSAFRSLGAGAQ